MGFHHCDCVRTARFGTWKAAVLKQGARGLKIPIDNLVTYSFITNKGNNNNFPEF